MITEIIIVGCGGFGREVADWCKESIGVKPIGFIDNDVNNLPSVINGLPVLGTDEWVLIQKNKCNLVVGIGPPHIRRNIYEKFKEHAIFPNVIHSSVKVGSEVTIQPDSGVIVTPGNIITCNIEIGKFVMVNLACTIGHDCKVGDFVTLSPGVNLSGRVNIGEGSYLGTNSSIVEKVNIGKWSVIGGQALVNKDLPDNVTAVGVPAKIIKERKENWHL